MLINVSNENDITKAQYIFNYQVEANYKSYQMTSNTILYKNNSATENIFW